MRSTARLAAAGLAALLTSVSGLEARAATLVVTHANDGGPGSLRDAVLHAAPGDAIVFDPALAGVPVVLASGQIVIDRDLTITGLGADRTVVDAGPGPRVFYVDPGVSATLAGMTLVGGRQGSGFLAEQSGTGIFNRGALTVKDAAVLDGIAISGGGIHNTGTLEIHRSTIAGNFAVNGGGIFSGAGAELTLHNCTVSGNWAANPEDGPAGGGGIHARGPTFLNHTTVTDNFAWTWGGGIDGTAVLKNSILVGNTVVQIGSNDRDTGGPDCFGTQVSLGYNIVGSRLGLRCRLFGGCSSIIACRGFHFSDLLDTDAAGVLVLDLALADNGGPTLTHALVPGSPAIDRIPLADCTDADGDPVLTDQRGVARPQEGLCDSGAFEKEPPIDPRSVGFWKHQCSDRGFAQVSREDLAAFFANVESASGAFVECASLGCEALLPDPPQNPMRPKAERQLLALWLNVVSGRLPGDTAIDLQPLSQAATVGEAIAEVESVLCDPLATGADLETAKDISESLNLGDDMEIVAPASAVTVRAGETASVVLALVNMSPVTRSYELTTSSAWPMRLSPEWVGDLGSGQIARITVDIDVPESAAGRTARAQVMASDVGGATGLRRDAVITLEAVRLPASAPQPRPILDEGDGRRPVLEPLESGRE